MDPEHISYINLSLLHHNNYLQALLMLEWVPFMVYPVRVNRNVNLVQALDQIHKLDLFDLLL